MTEESSIATRLAQVQDRIRAAAVRAGRAPDSVNLLPVSKTFGEDAIREAVRLGVRRFGENKAQEIRTKYEPLADCGIEWVMIGHLQTNKAKDIARMASEVRSAGQSVARIVKRSLPRDIPDPTHALARSPSIASTNHTQHQRQE